MEVQLGAGDRERLEGIIASRNGPQKHVWRAEIVVLSADRAGTMEIMRRTGRSKPTAWHWQQRFMEAGVDGLLHDKARPPGKPPLSPETVKREVAMTSHETPPEQTHWSARSILT